MAPLAFFNYGGMVAMQTLWTGPWMIRVAGYTPLESATGCSWINACMLVTFWSWGMVNPWLARHGWHATRLIGWGMPLSLAVLAFNIWGGASHWCRRLGAVLRGIRRHGAGPACGRHVVSGRTGQAGAVGLQPGHFL